MPRTSVIMPVFNGATHLPAAIQSVRQQSVQDWELIIVDDGSTDQTALILESVKDQRVRVFRQQNTGSAAARNVGLDAAEGEFVVFLDSDDLLLPEMLESNARFLDSHPEFGVVYSDGYYCDESGRRLWKLSHFRAQNVTGRILETLVTSPLLGASSCAMIRRSTLADRAIRFDQSLRFGEDSDLFLRLAETESFGYNPVVSCMYRIHKSNQTLTGQNLRREDLGRIRLGLLRSASFASFTVKTRATLVHQLLFESFVDSPEEQRELTGSPAFRSLPDKERGRLLRLVGDHWIVRNWPTKGATAFLERASETDLSFKSRVIYLAARLSPALLRLALRTRQRVRELASPRGPVSPFQRFNSEST